MEDMKEKYSREYFEQFMKNRGCKNTDEFTSYVMQLEEIKYDHERLKEKVEELNTFMLEYLH